MTDQELIEWIKALDNNDKMPEDTNERMTRLIRILINKAYPEKKNTLTLKKSA